MEERAKGSQEAEQNALHNCKEDRLTPLNQEDQG